MNKKCFFQPDVPVKVKQSNYMRIFVLSCTTSCCWDPLKKVSLFGFGYQFLLSLSLIELGCIAITQGWKLAYFDVLCFP